MNKMKRFTSLMRPKSQMPQTTTDHSTAPVDSPEANATHAIRLFCHSQTTAANDEGVLYLPTIVESAESSPIAATAAAHQIRKFLSKEYASKPHTQHNAVMLIRILADNPGPSFTRNVDDKFVKAVKEVLRTSKVPGTQQILRETLDAFEVNKGYDEGLAGLLQMWRREKGLGASLSHQGGSGARSRVRARESQVPAVQPGGVVQAPYGATAVSRDTLPLPQELASRVEEARNTAKILLQTIQSTPTEDVLGNDLIQEFGERCQGAQKSMQQYINCRNPEPDWDTMQTLIETNEQLSLAESRYQRVILAARRAGGSSPQPPQGGQVGDQMAQPQSQGAFMSPAVLAAFSSMPQPQQNGFGHQQPQQTSYDGFQGPAAPSHGVQAPQLSSLQYNPHSSYTQDRPGPVSDPFADTVESHPAAPGPSSQYGHQKSHFQSFNIDSEPTYAPTTNNTDPNPHSTSYLTTPTPASASSDLSHRPGTSGSGDSQYAVSPQASPARSPSKLQTLTSQAAQSPPRPVPGLWHNSEITPSYLGRQESAVERLAMHGAVELEGRDAQGRKYVASAEEEGKGPSVVRR